MGQIVQYTDKLIPPVWGPSITLVEWDLTNGDAGAFVNVPTHRDIQVQVYGTFGAGGTVNIEGSNEAGSPTHVVTLDDSRGKGNAATFTAAGMIQILQACMAIRPNCSAGDSTTSLVVLLKAAGAHGR